MQAARQVGCEQRQRRAGAQAQLAVCCKHVWNQFGINLLVSYLMHNNLQAEGNALSEDVLRSGKAATASFSAAAVQRLPRRSCMLRPVQTKTSMRICSTHIGIPALCSACIEGGAGWKNLWLVWLAA